VPVLNMYDEIQGEINRFTPKLDSLKEFEALVKTGASEGFDDPFFAKAIDIGNRERLQEYTSQASVGGLKLKKQT
jgi:hypothetical protein